MNTLSHHIIRTSAKGNQFVGRCVFCGQENLTMDDLLKPCLRPSNMLSDAGIIDLIEGMMVEPYQEPKPEEEE